MTSCRWTVGDGVSAEWHDRILSLSGSGKVDDFASAAELPWADLTVTNMTFASGVMPGKNTYAGLADTAMVNGTVPISLLRASAAEFLVGNLSPAEASALKIENGQIKMTVVVDESADLKTWKPAKTVYLDLCIVSVYTYRCKVCQTYGRKSRCADVRRHPRRLFD